MSRLAVAALALSCLSCGGEPATTGRAAPVVDIGEAPLAGGAPSLSALGAAVVDGLNAGDAAALEALTVTREEYTGRLFPALANHPGAEAMGRDVLWDMHARQSRDDLQRALDHHGRADLRFIRLEPRGLVRRHGAVFHERPRVIVADAKGEEHALQLLASVVEHEATHTFKLLGYRDHE